MIPFTTSDLFAPVTDLAQGDALEDWRWLVGRAARPLLLTAMGDVFLIKPGGLLRRHSVYLLETGTGRCERVASTYEELRELLSTSDSSAAWLLPELVASLRASGQTLSEGECYSPKLVPALGGTFEAANFAPVNWRVHLAITGQVHDNLKDVADGTKVKFEVVD